MIEQRYVELEYRAAAGIVEGVVVDYGDAAKIPGPGGMVMLERIKPGAFGSIGDVVANLQHDRQKPLARVLLARRVLRGLSVEMLVDAEEFKGPERIISKAQLKGLAVVDRPAYRMSTAALKRWSEIEDRAAFNGTYTMDQPETISDTPGRGVVRKRQYRPGAFDASIQDEAQEIGLLTSRNPNDAVASKRSGTLAIEREGSSLVVTASSVADTSAWADLVARRDAGLALGPTTGR